MWVAIVTRAGTVSRELAPASGLDKQSAFAKQCVSDPGLGGLLIWGKYEGCSF